MKTNIKRIFCCMLALLTMVSGFIVPASSVFASETDLGASPSQKGSITINYIDEGTKIEDDEFISQKVLIDGAIFSAALVAKEEVGKGRFEWIDMIKTDSAFNFETEDMFVASNHDEITEKIIDRYGDILKSEIRITDENGQCVFSNLEEGIYIVWETDKNGTAEKYESCVPFLVEVPDREKSPFDYDVQVFPKTAKITVKMISITGIKTWKGDTGTITITTKDKEGERVTKDVSRESFRPKEITLRLYANDVEVANTTTDAKKGWAFSFDDVNALDENGDPIEFAIKEDKVKHYVFTQDEPIIGENTIIINVTNTFNDESAKTGDETNIFLWIAIMGVSAAAIIILMVPKNRKKANATECSDEVEEIDDK